MSERRAPLDENRTRLVVEQLLSAIRQAQAKLPEINLRDIEAATYECVRDREPEESAPQTSVDVCVTCQHCKRVVPSKSAFRFSPSSWETFCSAECHRAWVDAALEDARP